MITRETFVAVTALSVCLAGCANTLPHEVRSELAPAGVLRVGLNLSTSLLAARDPENGEMRGVAIDIAHELGRRIGVPVQFVGYATGQLDKTIGMGEWDVAFFAIEPSRAEKVSFSPPYAEIETTYLVKSDALLITAQDVDRDGLTVAAPSGAGYMSMLVSSLKRANVLRTNGFSESLAHLINAKADAVAGLKPDLLAYAAKQPGFRVVDGKFGSVEQAMGIHKGRNAAAEYLRSYITDIRQSGFVAKSIVANKAGGLTIPR